MSRLLVPARDVPDWLRTLAGAVDDITMDAFNRFRPSIAQPRDAAVLILLGEREPGLPDVLLQLRADGLGAHSGQVAFPGGAAEPGDDGPVATALREAVEETGVDPSGVAPIALLPTLQVPVSGFVVTPVLAHWARPSRVWAVDPAESAAVRRVAIADLVDPANRVQVRHRLSGTVSPAFLLPGMVVWGFTAAVLTLLIEVGGWAVPWDTRDIRDLDASWRSVGPHAVGEG